MPLVALTETNVAPGVVPDHAAERQRVAPGGRIGGNLNRQIGDIAGADRRLVDAGDDQPHIVRLHHVGLDTLSRRGGRGAGGGRDGEGSRVIDEVELYAGYLRSSGGELDTESDSLSGRAGHGAKRQLLRAEAQRDAQQESHSHRSIYSGIH